MMKKSNLSTLLFSHSPWGSFLTCQPACCHLIKGLTELMLSSLFFMILVLHLILSGAESDQLINELLTFAQFILFFCFHLNPLWLLLTTVLKLVIDCPMFEFSEACDIVDSFLKHSSLKPHSIFSWIPFYPEHSGHFSVPLHNP